MSPTTNEDSRELGWDDRIDEPSEGDFVVFPDGIYPFTILSFTRGRHEASAKLPACNQATIQIEFYGGPQLGTNIVNHLLFLHTKTQGMLCQFFKGIGLRKSGEPLVIDFDAVAGRKGYAKLGSRVYEDTTYQDVKKFIDPEDWPDKTPAQVAQPAQPAPPAQPKPPVGDSPF